MSPRPLFPKTLRALVGLLLVVPTLAAALGTPAGTTIVNQASSVFTAPDTGLSTQANSNQAVMTVQAVCALSVSPDGTVAAPARIVPVLPGEQATFAYTLVNAGNAPFTFPVSGRVEVGSVVTPALRVVLDSDQDGVADPAEPEVTAVTLAADASAALLLIADATPAVGDAWVNLVAGCPGGQVDDGNVAQMKVGPPPELTVSKSFSPALVRPGSETTVSVSASNSGLGASREVVLSDLLTTQTAAGLSFVPGSAVTSAGTLEYTADGATWVAAEPTPVRGVRVRVDSLAPGAGVQLSFRMLAGASAENRVIDNTATLQSGPLEVSGSASADVRYLPAVAIGPVGTPEAPELSPADAQTRPFAALNQPVCFDHTVKNTGDVQDTFTISVAVSGATSTVSGAGGAALPQPLLLDPGRSVTVRVCYSATQVGPLDALVTVSGARGTQNTTRDLVAQVEAGLPELLKSAVATMTAPGGQPQVIPAGTPVAVGDTLTYTLSVRNPYTYPLSGVVIRDAVPAHLDAVSSDVGVISGNPGSQTLSWTLATLAPGETRTVRIVTTVSARAVDGETLNNTFTFSSAEVPGPLPSNEVRTPVWSAKLVVTKSVSAREATYGDRLTYTLTISNTSTTTDIVDAVITDTPVSGLDYLPGTSRLGGQLLADPALSPTASGSALRWTLASLAAGATVSLSYDLRVTPAASGDLVNVVEVRGNGAGGVARAIASNRASVSAKLNALRFGPQADLVGVVFVDRNRNGLFDEGLDTPMPRARILLAGGRQALTDTQGRYSFLNVQGGTQALRLDPATTPYLPLSLPQDGGLSGTHTVFARGLTSVDFPLAPLGGDIAALRSTALILGDVRVEKSVFAVPGGYLVTLRVITPRALVGAELVDPLPAGATLKEGRNTHTGTLVAGETTLTYRFDWAGDARSATTDPLLTWRPDP